MSYIQLVNESFFNEKSESINEGLIAKLNAMFKDKIKKMRFPKKAYSCNLKLKQKTEVVNNTISEAIMRYCNAIYQVQYDKENKVYYTDSMSKIEKDKNIVHIGSYKLVDTTNYNTGVYALEEEIESGTISELINKHDIKIEVRASLKDMRSRRSNIYKTAIKIAKNVISDVSKTDKMASKGFKNVEDYPYFEENVEDFLSGFDNWIYIIHCDAWEYTGNRARDEEYYEKFEQCLFAILNKFEKELKKSIQDIAIDYDADWDSGCITIYDKKKYN